MRIKPEYLHPYCQQCRKTRLVQEPIQDNEGNHIYERGEFIVDCVGIPKDGFLYLDGKLFEIEKLKEAGYSDEYIDKLMQITNPEYWAFKNVIRGDGKPWTSRISCHKDSFGLAYQGIAIRCNSPRKTCRWGRRCLTGDTNILLENGQWEKIIDIKSGDKVVSLEKDKLISNSVVNFFDNGIQKIYELTLMNGLHIKATENHPFLCKKKKENQSHYKKDSEWVNMSELNPRDKIALISGYESWGNEDYEDLGKLLGYLLTDGYIRGDNQTPKFTNNNPKMIEEVKSISKKLFNYECSQREKGKGWDLHITDKNRGTRNKLLQLLKELRIIGLKSNRKKLPDTTNWNKKSTLAMINRMYSGDGSVSYWDKGRNDNDFGIEINLTSSSPEMLEQVQLVLMKLGIFGSIVVDCPPGHKKAIFGTWKLRIMSSGYIKKFLEEVGLIFGKEEKCLKVLEILNRKESMRDKLNETIQWITIKNIEEKGFENTYDIEVENTHNFIANGIVSHNSGKGEILTIEMLHFAFTNSPKTEMTLKDGSTNVGFSKVLVMAPYKEQVEVLFQRIREYIYNSPKLAACVVHDVKSPTSTIELSNGVTIKGFSAGTNSNAGAASSRGQDGHLIVIDEADSLNEDDLTSIRPILGTRMGGRLIVTSTPTGAREEFYNMCNDPEYKEFHFPSHVSPEWGEKLDLESQRRMTRIGYAQEILALFGELEAGVFQKKFIDSSLRRYAYSEMSPSYGMIPILGVDWNDTENGTVITTVEWNPLTGIARKVDYSKVSREGWTQTLAVNEIIRLNDFWKPEFIYVDEGYGAMQIEVLKNIGLQETLKNPGSQKARLAEIIRPYNFSSSVEVTDPITSEKTNKRAKPFLVENGTRFFEHSLIDISEYDFELIRQLENFILKNKSQNGQQTYTVREKSVGDHSLISLLLALVGITLEFNSLIKTKIVERIEHIEENVILKSQGNACLSSTMKNEIKEREVSFSSENEHSRIITHPDDFTKAPDEKDERGNYVFVTRFNRGNSRPSRRNI